MSPDSPSSSSFSDSIHRVHSAIQSLSLILGPLSDSLTLSDNPALSLLRDPDVARTISTRLRQPSSGAGDDTLCRWLYDTFQSMDPDLQLTVLKFVPMIAGIYLSRAVSRKPVAGFEAVLLALYAHETKSRASEPMTVILPNLSNPSLYHETKSPTKNRAVELNIAVLSPALEPHGTVRSTKRARIVGVALELYYSKISNMPISSKLDFCEFCVSWAGQYGVSDEIGECNSGGIREVCGEKGCRIPLPWELFQPMLRILGHCLLGPSDSEELKGVAFAAVRRLHDRAIHEMSSQAILGTRSLLRLREMAVDSSGDSVLRALSDFEEPGITPISM